MSAIKWLLKCLHGSPIVGLVYKQGEKYAAVISGFCNSDYAANLDKQRLLIGYIFTFEGNVISWKFDLKHVVTFSTMEVKYIAFSIEAIKEALWLYGITKKLGFKRHIFKVHCDSQNTIHLSKNNTTFYEMTKYIDVRLYFVRDIVSQG